MNCSVDTAVSSSGTLITLYFPRMGGRSSAHSVISVTLGVHVVSQYFACGRRRFASRDCWSCFMRSSLLELFGEGGVQVI